MQPPHHLSCFKGPFCSLHKGEKQRNRHVETACFVFSLHGTIGQLKSPLTYVWQWESVFGVIPERGEAQLWRGVCFCQCQLGDQHSDKAFAWHSCLNNAGNIHSLFRETWVWKKKRHSLSLSPKSWLVDLWLVLLDITGLSLSLKILAYNFST